MEYNRISSIHVNTLEYKIIHKNTPKSYGSGSGSGCRTLGRARIQQNTLEYIRIRDNTLEYSRIHENTLEYARTRQRTVGVGVGGVVAGTGPSPEKAVAESRLGSSNTAEYTRIQ